MNNKTFLKTDTKKNNKIKCLTCSQKKKINTKKKLSTCWSKHHMTFF